MKTSWLSKNAAKEKKHRGRTQANVPQIQEWTLLQKDDCGREMQVPVRKQGGGRGWFLSWLFGSEEDKKNAKEKES